MPNIEVRDADGKVLNTYQILADTFGNIITDEVMFDMVRRNAVEDELVSEDDADQLTFKIIG